MSPSLFNICMDGVLRLANTRMLGRSLNLEIAVDSVEDESTTACR